MKTLEKQDPPAAEAVRSSRKIRSFKSWGQEHRWTLVSLGTLVVIWHVVSIAAGRTPNGDAPYVPSLLDMVVDYPRLGFYWRGGLGVPTISEGGSANLLTATLALIQHSVATIGRMVAGFAAGSVAAMALASVVGFSSTVRRLFLLPAHITRMLPIIAMIPLFGIWFGNSEMGAFTFVAFGTFATIFMSSLTAIGNIPSYYSEYARSLGASRLKSYLTVLPAGIPSIRGGFLLSLSFGWSMVIGAELIGQSVGIGAVVKLAELYGQTGIMAVLSIFVLLYAFILYQLMASLVDRLVQWHE